MAKRILFPIILLATLLAACGQPDMLRPTSLPDIRPTSLPDSGIDGKVLIGPMCPGPVPIDNTSCQDQPYQATIVVLDSQKKEITTVVSDSAGIFKLYLSPGSYTLHPVSELPLPRASDLAVTVNPGQFTQVTIQYDTGMR